jgi:hypothetical protein
MRKYYIIGAVLSAIAHSPLVKEKEYGAFVVATFAWPMTLLVWGLYTHYLLWGTYQHEQILKRRKEMHL